MQPEILLFSSHSEKIVKKVDSTYYIRSSFSDKISLYKNLYINVAFFFSFVCGQLCTCRGYIPNLTIDYKNIKDTVTYPHG